MHKDVFRTVLRDHELKPSDIEPMTVPDLAEKARTGKGSAVSNSNEVELDFGNG
jgi:hypothetical protein